MTTALAPKDTLFELSEEMRTLDALLTDLEGETTEAIDRWRAEFADRLADKADSIGFYAKTLQNEEEFFKAQRDDLDAKAKRAARKRDWLKGYIAFCLAHMGERSVKGQVYTLALQKNGGRAALRLLNDDPSAFPVEYQKYTLSVDTQAVRIAVEQGRIAPELAVLEPVGDSVRIR